VPVRRSREAELAQDVSPSRPWRVRRTRAERAPGPLRGLEVLDAAASTRVFTVELPAVVADWTVEKAREQGVMVSDVVAEALELLASCLGALADWSNPIASRPPRRSDMDAKSTHGIKPAP